MANKKSFLEMHNALGGSYSSPERVQQEQEQNQKRQEKTAEINLQAVTQPKQPTQKAVTSTGNQKKSTAPSGALPGIGSPALTGEKNLPGSIQGAAGGISAKIPAKRAPTTGAVQNMNQLLFFAVDRKQAVKKGQDPMFVYVNSEVGRAKEEATKQISTMEQTIKELQGKKKPVGMDRTNVPYNEEIDSQIAALQGQIDSTRQQVADMNDILISAMPEGDRKLLEKYAEVKRNRAGRDASVSMSGGIPLPWLENLLWNPNSDEYSALKEKYGEEQIDQLAETLIRQSNAQEVQQMQEAGVKAGAEHPFLGSLLSIPTNVMAGATSVLGRAAELGTRTGQYPTLDPNNPYNIGTYGSSIQGQVVSDIEGEDPNFLRKAGSYAYRGGMSALESALRATTGKAGTVLLSGLGSFEQNVAKASAQGASPEKAVLLGLTNATIEALSEEIPLDNLLDAAKGGKQTFEQALKLALAQAGIEATTEEVSLIGSTLAEAAILQEKSEFNQYIQSRMAEGVDYQTARGEAFQNLLGEAVDTAIVSAVSGGGMSVVNSLVTNYTANKQEKNQPSTQPQQESAQAPSTPLQGEAADPRQLAQQQEQAREAAQAMEQEQQAQAAQQEAPQAPPATDPMLEGIQTPVAPAQEQPQQAAPGRKPLDRVIAETLGQDQDQQQPPAAVDTPQEVPVAPGNMLDGIDIPQDTTQEQTGPNPVADMLAPILNPQNATGTAEDTSTVVNTNPEIHTAQEQAVINEYQNSVDENLVDYIEAVQNNQGGKMPKYPLKNVSDRAASDIKQLTGVDVAGNKVQIEPRIIEHILKDHGENGISDHSMRDVNDIARIQYVIDNYDSIEHGGTSAAYVYQNKYGRNAQAQTVVMKKKVNGTYFVVEAVPDTKKKTVYVTSAYMSKDGTQKAAGSLSGDANAPRVTSQNATKNPTAFGTSIPTVGENVNGNMGNSVGSPRIKGTGAAEANFTQKPAYNATLSAENAQPDRASDVRPMELPKTDINGNPISAVTGNAYGSKITTDELASLMEEPTARGDFSYARISNDQATQKAMDTIAAAGDWESAYNQWAKDVGAGKAGAEMTARGALFLNHFAKEGNKTQWLNTLADMQDLGTNTAQGLQAMRLVRELAPQDKVRFVEMATKRLGQQMGVDFQVDQSLYDAYNNATTDEARNAALDDIQQNIADQIPSTALDKWNALRYTNMLGNLKTNVRNVAGNVGAGAMYRVKDQIAATMEDVLHAATKGKFEKTKSHTVSWELLNACKQDFDNVSGIVSDGGKFGSRDSFSDQFVQGAMDKRRIFKSDNKILNAAMAPMESYRKATNWMMNNQYFGDEAFGKAAYARSLAGYLKAHGVTDTDLSKVDTALMDKARAYAVQEAQEATFHDNSALARTLSRLKRDTGAIGEGIMPFTKTPANVLTRAAEFSPLGFFDAFYKTAQAGASKTSLVEKPGLIGNFARSGVDITGTDLVNSLSKSLTGAGIFVLGAWLKNQGFLTGGPDDDDEKDAFDKLNGDQNYAIRFTIGGKTYNYTFDWLTPAAMPLFMGAQLMDILDKGFENITFADLDNVFTNIADPMLQMSMLQSLNDSLDNIKYTDNNLGQFFINAAVSYLTQGLSNTLVGQIERSTEKNRMTTYVDKNSQLPAWMQRQIGSLSQKIPGWDYQQTEYRNAYGETEENEGGLLYNLLSPGYISEEKSNALSQELYRLNDAGVDGNVFPDSPDTTLDYTDSEGNRHDDYHLSAGEADRLKEVAGKTTTNLLSDMIETDLYKAMSDQQKADAVRKVYDYARELGRTEAIDGYQGMDTWMEAARENPTKAILDRVVKAGFDDAFDSLTHAWEYDKDPASAVSALEDAYAVYSGMDQESKKEFKENTDGKVGYFLDAKDAGIDGETFTELYKTYSDIDAQDSDASAKARNWAYYLNKEKAAGNITAAQEAKLKDSMAYHNTFPADAGKFDNLTEAGLSADTAAKVSQLMEGITGTGKDGYVRPIDRYMAIAGSGLSAKDKETALLEYAPDAMDDKYNYAKKNMTKNGKGITIDDFVRAYQVTDEYSKKKEQIDAWQAMGYTKAEAENLYKLYNGKLT